MKTSSKTPREDSLVENLHGETSKPQKEERKKKKGIKKKLWKMRKEQEENMFASHLDLCAGTIGKIQ